MTRPAARPDAALLFAAGFGTRMAPLTDTRPKPLIEVTGRALLDHALDMCDGVSLARRVVNTHYRAAQIAQHLAARPETRDVALSHETPEILETGGGLRHALPLLGAGPVFTLNTDAIWTGPNPLAALAAAWDPDRMDALLMCVPADRATGHAGGGDFARDATGALQRGGPLVYGGVQIIDPASLSGIAETAFSLNLAWNASARAGRLHGLVHPGGWCDVGRPESIALAEGMLADV
jgi:MurNAc alpha-1-phosphate uridylyltransferase